jgi:hypothetical protein
MAARRRFSPSSGIGKDGLRTLSVGGMLNMLPVGCPTFIVGKLLDIDPESLGLPISILRTEVELSYLVPLSSWLSGIELTRL